MAVKVAVAMSGGVDSSVAALLLQRQGYLVVGVTMKLYATPTGSGQRPERAGLSPSYRGCCTIDDVEDARSVCRRLGVPHYVLNVQREFQAHVIDYFCSEYRRGRTPHPCIACNDKIKFSFLMTRAAALRADYVATGHYAVIERTPQGMVLKKGVDAAKDQSYVLFGMGQRELARTLMPVGAYSKDAVRRMAQDAGLCNALKPDSQDICFIPFGNYRAFLNGKTPPSPGEMVEPGGNVLGRHRGIEFYTVGQRRGLGIASGRPYYVLRLEPETNRVVVGPERGLYQDRMWVSRVNYTLGTPPDGPVEVGVKIRYRSQEARALLHPRPEGALVCFEGPQRAVAPGQAAVFYRGDVLLGGGTIERDEPGGCHA